MERKNDEVTYFGHRIPSEIYEDYEKIKKLKQLIEKAVDDSTIDATKKEEIKNALQKMSTHLGDMKSNAEHKPNLFN